MRALRRPEDEGKPARHVYEDGRILRKYGDSWEAVDWDKITEDLIPNAPIRSKAFIIAGEAGKGAWGTVFAAKNRETGERVALKVLTPTELAKEQMQQRNLDEDQTLKKEAGKLVAASHVVPRTLEHDDEGRPFIRMPLYKRTLADEIRDVDDSFRARVGRGITPERAIKILRDVAEGVHEMQTRYKQVHPDIHPGNIVEDFEDESLLTDLGSATATTAVDSRSRRDNIGAIQTRAYECFAQGSRPTRASNSYALGALTYRLFTGEYPFENEIANARDPGKYFADLDEKVASTMIKQKAKRLPRAFRPFFRACMAHDAYKRPANGSDLKKELEKAIRNTSRWRRVLNAAKIPLIALGSAAVLGWALYKAETHTPTSIDMPPIQWEATQLDTPKIQGPPLFVGEDLKDLPRTTEKMEETSIIRMSSPNKYAAGLFKAYIAAMDQLHKEGIDINEFTEAQHRMQIGHSLPDEIRFSNFSTGYGPVPKSIEIAMYQAQTPNKKIDLEDTLAIGRLGVDLVNQARYAANSRDFANYITARDDRGNFVIPQNEQRFLKTWLAYVESERGEK
jgi:hypothetical protein